MEFAVAYSLIVRRDITLCRLKAYVPEEPLKIEQRPVPNLLVGVYAQVRQ